MGTLRCSVVVPVLVLVMFSVYLIDAQYYSPPKSVQRKYPAMSPAENSYSSGVKTAPTYTKTKTSTYTKTKTVGHPSGSYMPAKKITSNSVKTKSFGPAPEKYDPYAFSPGSANKDKYVPCDVNSPNEPHESDCHKFYQCDISMYGQPTKVEKTCGPHMYYNPITMTCDWPDTVKKIRPECGHTDSSAGASASKRCESLPPQIMNGGMRCSSGHNLQKCEAYCIDNYEFFNSATTVDIICEDGEWNYGDTGLDTLPFCSPICHPECVNGGICISPGRCNCPENYDGDYCQYENKPCMTMPKNPSMASMKCNMHVCNVICLKGTTFPDKSKASSLECKNGEWVIMDETWQGYAKLPDCGYHDCTPPCQNGGTCWKSKCVCPSGFFGHYCEEEDTGSSSWSFPAVNEDNDTSYSWTYHNGTTHHRPGQTWSFQNSSGTRHRPDERFYYNASQGQVPDTWDEEREYGGGAIRPIDPSNPDPVDPFHEPQTVPPPTNQVYVFEPVVPKPGSCFTWDRLHYKTFDGEVYSFASGCSHILVKDVTDDTFTIAVKNSDTCFADPSNCYRVITIYYQSQEFVLERSDDGYPILSNGRKTIAIPGQFPGIRAELSAHYIIVSLDSVGVTIHWDGNLLIEVEVSEGLWNRTAGLCGRLDGYKSNDMETQSGVRPRNVASLASDWQITPLEGEVCDEVSDEHVCKYGAAFSMTERAKAFCDELLYDSRFAACSKVVDVSTLHDACTWSYCACGKQENAECACETMNVYVKECTSKGVTGLTKWRDSNTCPLKCTGGRVYKSCGSAKGQPVCGSLTQLPDNSDEPCFEGCYCPEGTVLHQDRCITVDECPCQLRGKPYPPGSKVPKVCNTCTCTDGIWNCTDEFCGARCSAIGDPHYTTFDGKKYDFMGQCSYYLIRGDDYSIEAENVACSGAISKSMNIPLSISSGLPSCTKTVTIKFRGQTIKLKQNHEVVINGQDLNKIPYQEHGVFIRSLSSLYLSVVLPNAIEVLWDGHTKVYIDAPKSLKGHTKGLCGTFNKEQKDDFLTPENDVEESVIAFANKWKTNELCEDIPEEIKSHPCNLNVQNKVVAEKHCQKLLFDELFKECRPIVDPDVFYQDCLYDMCSCNGMISQCLCPIIASYAEECSRNNIKIDWRDEVKECGLHCVGGQKYQVCGNPCTRSCHDISVLQDCRAQCVEGCNCPEGEALDELGECVPIEECKCYKDGVLLDTGYKEIRSGVNGTDSELCMCVRGKFACRPATPEEVFDYPQSNNWKTFCDQSANKVFTTCEPVEPITCKNMHAYEGSSPAFCHAGCKCREGYVLDSKVKKCVKPSECSCHHGGRSYSEKSKIKNNCNTCECTHGKWECTDNQCSATCSAWGDSHYTTFDDKHYDFQGQCDYVLSKGSNGFSEFYEISTQNVPCGTLGTTCSKAITVKVGSGPEAESLTLTRGKEIPNFTTLKHLTMRQKGPFVIVEAPDLGLTVRWDKGTRVYVTVDPRWKNLLQGLCGNFNNNNQDDFQTPSGGITEASVNIFGDSWRLQSYCPEAIEIVDTCAERPDRKIWALKKCGILKSSIFAPCHSEVPLDNFFERCVFDTCACDSGGDCECLCTAVAAYADKCNAKGIPIRWRSPEFCPMQCDETCTNYVPCVSTCPTENCDNTVTLSKLSKFCKQESCVESCEPKPCPDGQIYLNASHTQCVSKAVCKPVCMVVDGIEIYEGDVIEEDDCHRCVCSRGQRICKGRPCTTVIYTTTAVPTVVPSFEQIVDCVSGWTEWIDQDKPLPAKKGPKKKTEIEPIPSVLLMARLIGSKCDPERISDIECRTVRNHTPWNETKQLEVTCDPERGLFCKTQKRKGCPDFEIRVKCKCDSVCDVNHPNQPHESDCHKFYHCDIDMDGKPKRTEKTCGSDMLYNTESMVCDWPYNVIDFRPECQNISVHEEIVTVEPEPSRDIFEGGQNNTKSCPVGLIWHDCATQCHKLCLYYQHALIESGVCGPDSYCAAGCVYEDARTECPPGMLWVNNATCVAQHDCLCISHTGQPVRPGMVHRESDCEMCQCIDNYYTCDRSSCDVQPPPIIHFGPVPPEGHTIGQSIEPTIYPYVVTPPKKCQKENLIYLVQGDEPLPDSAFSASSTLGPSFAPENARITKEWSLTSSGSWSPAFSNTEQYLQINFETQEPVYGVIVKGSPLYREYVTSYKVLYSPDGRSFMYILNKGKRPQSFRGSFDKDTPVEQLFAVPVEAKAIRINPETWNQGISLKVELLGCGEDKTTTVTDTQWVTHTTIAPDICEDELGFSDGRLSEKQVSVSSELVPGNKKNLKIGGSEYWRPLTNSPTEYVQFDFTEPRNVTGLKTKGGPIGWVTGFTIEYSQNGIDWSPVTDDRKNNKLFPGNYDSHTLQLITFEMILHARYVRVVPKKWHKNIQLQVEIVGCYEPYPIVTTITPSNPKDEEMNVTCLTCDGVERPRHELSECECPDPLYWDGENCVHRKYCPCIEDHIRYVVGAVYEKEDCSECMCKIGGIPHCRPKSCEKCQQGYRSTVTSTCACTCKPCPPGTTLCPTSNICIDSSLWCNGIQDCPDDEVNCHTTAATTPAPTTTEAPEECPVKDCGPGYKLITVYLEESKTARYHMNLSPMYQMNRKTKSGSYQNTKTKGRNQSRHYGTKGGRIPLDKPNISQSYKNETIKEYECPVYLCKPLKPPPKFIITPSECPPSSCPVGYLTKYEDIDPLSKNCPDYECVPPPPPDSVCNVTGRTFSTFDGTEYKYDICDHILVRDFVNDEWNIRLQKNCTTVCTRDLIIYHEDHAIVFHTDLSLEYDGYHYSMEHVTKLGSQMTALQISLLGKSLLFVSNRFGFWAMWNDRGDVKIGIVQKLAGRADGLCGFFDLNPENDKRRPDGKEAKTTAQFGDSWAQDGKVCDVKSCPIYVQDKAWDMCNKIKDPVLAKCASVIDIESFLSHCIETACECLEARPGNRTDEEECRCEAVQSYVVSCMAAEPRIELSDWRVRMDCPATCESPFVYQDCHRRKCEATCQSLSDPNVCPKIDNLCFPGCYCPPGTVRKDDRCLKPSECRDCECNLLPHLQYITYDEANFTVTGNCVYTMSRDVLVSQYDEHKFQLLVTNAPCEDQSDKMCVGKITILYEGHKIFIFHDIKNQNLRFVMDGEWIEDPTELSQWIAIRVTPAKHLKILLIDAQVEVSVYYPSLGVSVKAPSHRYGGKLEGLCGDCNKVYKDDMRLPNGELTEDENELALGWLYENLPGGQSKGQCSNRKPKECHELPEGTSPCEQIMDLEVFGQCHNLLDPRLFLEWCRKDICGGNVELACNVIESYARECGGRHGLCVNWRSSICPASGCPAGFEYDPCGTTCPKTCEGLNGKLKKKCKERPVEGCFCPQGKVKLNDTCVVPKDCEVCDNEGHHPGDIWVKDKCTTCECDGTSLKCEEMVCSGSNTVCEKGFSSITIPAGPDECCDKYACVPEPTSGPTCEPPTKIVCGDGQILKLDTKPNGCQQFICECKPRDECEKPDLKSEQQLGDGYVAELDETGCCPVAKITCKPELCPPPKECPQFHSLKNETSFEKCCPFYSCEPPKDKCVFQTEYIQAELGGEKPRSENEKKELLKKADEVWYDGPCRECKCSQTKLGNYLPSCHRKECQTKDTSPDIVHYELEEYYIPGECCPNIKRVACKVGSRTYQIGEHWFLDDYCTSYTCSQTLTGEITKETTITTCEMNCGLGSRYVAPPDELKQCCGLCRPVACVFEDKLYEPGEVWYSDNYCTKYECKNVTEGEYQRMQVRSVDFSNSCQNNTQDWDDYEYKTIHREKECCPTHEMVACKHKGKLYQVGETVYDNEEEGKCRQLTCAKNSLGKLLKREMIETCVKDCPLGWEYKVNETSCCGRCEPVGCVVNGEVKQLNESWTYEDGCSTGRCEMYDKDFVVVYMQQACAPIEDCPEENVVMQGCCRICNITSVSLSLCVPNAMNFVKTVGIIRAERDFHGLCKNKKEIYNLNECVGNCHSSTMYYEDKGQYKDVCTCCRASEYKPIDVELECEDGYKFTKKISVPSKCGCEKCGATATKTKVKTG